jgi:hypothetical protein
MPARHRTTASDMLSKSPCKILGRSYASHRAEVGDVSNVGQAFQPDVRLESLTYI